MKQADYVARVSVAIVVASLVLLFTQFNSKLLVKVLIIVFLSGLLIRCMSSRSFEPAMKFARCLVPLALGGIFVGVYILLHQHDPQFDTFFAENFGINFVEILQFIRFNDSNAEQFYTALATLYSIVLGLALLKGVEDIENAKRDIGLEVECVRSSSFLLDYLEDNEIGQSCKNAKSEIRRILGDYGRTCAEGNDQIGAGEGQIKARREIGSAPAAALLRECQKQIMNLSNVADGEIQPPPDADDIVAKETLMRKLDHLSSLRVRRIDYFARRPSRFLMSALWLMALALVLPFLAEPLCTDLSAGSAPLYKFKLEFNNPAASQEPTSFPAPSISCPVGLAPNPERFSQYYIIFVLTSFLSFIMFMLHDVVNPRTGFWRVDLSDFGATGVGNPSAA